MRVKFLGINAAPTPPTLAGLFFCLASDTVQGFYFARMQYSSIQAFTACFAVSMQLYHPRHKTAHRALQRLFLRLYIFNRPRYKADKSSYNVTCATLEDIHAPGRAQPIPDTTATPGRYAGQHRPPIIIMYIRGQTMPATAGQRLHLHRVSAAGSRCFPRPAAGGLAPGQRSGRAPSTRRGSPAAGGAEPLAAPAASLFGLSPDS